MEEILKQYLKGLTETSKHDDAREESYYGHLDRLIKQYAERANIKNIDITILPKKTEAGNPDFRIWDGHNHITGYIEAKAPSVTNLDYIEETAQLKRYLSTFPNVILTNFYEFRLYRNRERIAQVTIGRSMIAKKLQITPVLENVGQFKELLERFFSFTQPKVQSARSLAVELAKRTRFLRDEVIAVEIQQKENKGHKQILGIYEAFKKYLIATLKEKQFADLYAQTITYGLFAARTRAVGNFNRKLAFDYIPHTNGILRDVFRFISLEEPPKSLQIIVDDIAEILNVTDVDKILHEYKQAGKGRDPIIHFYETFLETYDPEIRERRGVYYTPEPVVAYIVRSIHSILKSHFNMADGLADSTVKLLDPAGGTLTFPAEAIRIAAKEFIEKYGKGGLNSWIKKHILANFYSFELMMAPYAIGHLKMSFVFEELGYRMNDDERFQLYLTNTLEMEEIKQTAMPGLSSLSEESHLAGKIKKEQPVLVILGNPPYSGHSANRNKWTEKLLKNDNIEGVSIQSFYNVDGKKLDEKNPKWLQDDYVKFLRFAQWKIESAGSGIVGMITNHSYLDNPTFRGMRQSLMKTFDEIYILDLHGNSLKKEKTPDGGKDENIFDIRQGVAIAIFVKNQRAKKTKVFHRDLYGLRQEKYDWLSKNKFSKANYKKINPQTPYYFLVKRETDRIRKYLKWKKINEIFPVNSVGIVTARDELTIKWTEQEMWRTVLNFSKLDPELARQTYNLGTDARDWKVEFAQKDLMASGPSKENIKPVLYRPFDVRFTYYTGKSRGFLCMPRSDVMHNMLDGDNLGLITHKREELDIPWSHALITSFISEHGVLSSKTTSYHFPLYIYPEQKNTSKTAGGSSVMMVFEPQSVYGIKPNITPAIIERLEQTYGKEPSPENILYYIYAVLYSNIYRETYGEFLKIDFPRVPFTADYKIFMKLSKYGKKLADLHLQKNPLLERPVAKYQGTGTNDRIESIVYVDNERRIYINSDKYFENVSLETWKYHIGGYQVLKKYLKDRKGKTMDNAPLFCRIVTALSKSIEIQKKIDEIYPYSEKELIQF